MGDDRSATRAPGRGPAAEKKGAVPDAGGGGGLPDGAAADPGSALTTLAVSYGAQLIGVLQGAGGNAETDAELTSLQESKQAAATAKADKDNVNQMTDGQKIEKFGGKKESKGPPPAEGTPPPGVADPGATQAFHAQRGSQLTVLAEQHAAVAAQLLAAAALPGLAPELIAFLTEGSSQSQAQQAALQALAAAYAATAGELAGSEFIGVVGPSPEVPALYQARAASYQSVVTTVDTMNGEYTAALNAEQGKIAECEAAIGMLQKQIAEAEASAKSGKKEGAGGAEKKVAPGAEKKAEPPPMAKPAGSAAKESSGKGGGAEGKSSKKGGEASPDKKKAAKEEGATSKKTDGGGGGGPAKEGDAGAKEAIAGMLKQIEAQKSKKMAIEAQIRANEGLVATMRAYRESMNALLTAYQTALGIGPPPPSGGG